MQDMPNAFIGDDGCLYFVNVVEMTPEDIGIIAEAKAYCNKIEKEYGTNSIDDMMRNGISFKKMKQYISARHELIMWGYAPEDWA